ncbi:MAG: prolipoprotein diacylglyceryl transferase, partial [Bacteroidetes bacterium]|nr:prolipoprotein diacylglyceryl transferase [Bacteroidota bacterium]
FFLKEVFGIEILLPIKTFGLFMALSFMGAYMVLYRELKRKTQEGFMPLETITVTTGKKISTTDFVIYILVGFLLGYKLGPIFADYQTFANDPQVIILSLSGNFLTGLIGAIGFGLYAYRELNKKTEEKTTQVTTGAYDLHLGNFTAIAAIAGILGAKLFHNLENIDELIEDPVGSLLSFSGLTFYGGLICSAIGIIIYARKKNIPIIPMVDSFAPAMMLSYGIGRIGCHLSGDGDWGIPNTAPKPSFMPDWLWSYDYPHNVVNAGPLIPGATTDHFQHHLVPSVYPTALYEAITCILLFMFLWSIRKRVTTPGLLFGIYLVINGLERFLIEKIRVNPDYHFFGIAATQATIIALCLILGGIAMIIYSINRNKKKEAPLPS